MWIHGVRNQVEFYMKERPHLAWLTIDAFASYPNHTGFCPWSHQVTFFCVCAKYEVVISTGNLIGEVDHSTACRNRKTGKRSWTPAYSKDNNPEEQDMVGEILGWNIDYILELKIIPVSQNTNQPTFEHFHAMVELNIIVVFCVCSAVFIWLGH